MHQSPIILISYPLLLSGSCFLAPGSSLWSLEKVFSTTDQLTCRVEASGGERGHDFFSFLVTCEAAFVAMSMANSNDASSSGQLLPEDYDQAIDFIIDQLKSRGIFDSIRCECLSDIDTRVGHHFLFPVEIPCSFNLFSLNSLVFKI